MRLRLKLTCFLSLIVLITTLYSLFSVFFYSLFGLTVNQLVLAVNKPDTPTYLNQTPLTNFILLSLLQIILAIISMLLGLANDYLLERAIICDKLLLRRHVFDAINSLPYLKIYQRLTDKQLLSLILNDVKSYSSGRLTYLKDLLLSILTTLFSLSTLFLYHWSLAVMVFVGTILSTICSFSFKGRLTSANKALSQANNHLTEQANDLLTNYETLYLNDRQDYLKNSLLVAAEPRYNSLKRISWLKSLLYLLNGGITEFLLFAVTFTALLFTAFIPSTGIDIGSVIATFSIFGSLMPQFQGIIASIVNLRGLKPFKERLITKQEHEQEQVKNKGITSFEGIEISNLSLNFGKKAIFRELNLVIKPGKRYAIIGPSGVGKSSLIRLISGLISDYQGVIRLNGHDYRDISSREISNLISLNQGDNLVFEGSIAENIKLWEKEGDITNPLRLANFNLEELGLDEDAAALSLSEGQKQRVCLARNFFEDKPLFIFDESFANLDKENVSKIKENLTKMVGKTIILVSHHIDKDDPFFDEIVELD